MRKQQTRNNCKAVNYIIALYLVLIVMAVTYRTLSFEKVKISGKINVFVPTGSTMDEVVDILREAKVITKDEDFLHVVNLYGYKNIKSGRYIIKSGMSLREVAKMLSTGQQTPINMVIAGNIREKEKLAGIISSQIEADSLTVLELLNDKVFLKSLGFTPENSILLFLPNTYNIYWNRSPKKLFEDMKQNYDKFWNTDRLNKLKNTGLTKDEVMILASIVVEESNKVKEQPTIAGVYVNRLNKRMPLQADPTVKFAVGDFSLRRVLNEHTAYNSPYNTYLNAGLPPGPICIPQESAIDAVLNFEKHDYLYFCAKSDMSGYHSFAKTLQQHNVNANEYRNALNKLKIYR